MQKFHIQARITQRYPFLRMEQPYSIESTLSRQCCSEWAAEGRFRATNSCRILQFESRIVWVKFECCIWLIWDFDCVVVEM